MVFLHVKRLGLQGVLELALDTDIDDQLRQAHAKLGPHHAPQVLMTRFLIDAYLGRDTTASRAAWDAAATGELHQKHSALLHGR